MADSFVFRPDTGMSDKDHKGWIDVLSTDFGAQPPSRAESVPVETLTMNYEEIKVTYRETDGHETLDASSTYLF